jgi:hypothetical protein
MVFLDGADLVPPSDIGARRDSRTPEMQITVCIAVVAENIDPQARSSG